MTRAVTEPAVVVDEMFDDGAPLPPAPSRPASNTRIMGLPGDAWAAGVETKIDILFKAQREDTKALETKVDSNQRQTNDNFDRLFTVLATIERHERALQDQQRQLNDQEQARFKLEDRITKLERGHVKHAATIAKLNKAAATRAKGK